jgi:hypothetical protein
MHALLQQLPALIGVVIGALASYLTAAAGERARWRREHDERWDAKRLEAYASYGLAVKQFILMASRISASHGLGPRAQPLPASEENLEQLAQAEVDRATAWEQVLLIGDPATIAAARRWHQRAWELEHFARGIRTGSEGWAATYAAADDARAEFYRNARHDLSVVGNLPASGDRLPPVSLPDDGEG